MKRAALFVGINDYIKPIASLKCARKDADTLYRLFLDQYSPGLVDYLHDVDSDEIIKSIDKTMDQLEDGDLFFLYFSGHGIEERNNHYLLTSGARLIGDEWQHALSINKLKFLTRKRGVQTIIVIDSCRESVYYGARSICAAAKSRTAKMEKLVAESIQEAVYLPPVILCSCAGGERAFEIEESGHGIFTLALKESLESGNFSTLDEIVDNVTKRLKTLIKEFNLDGHQTPEIHKAPSVNPILWGNPQKKQENDVEVAKKSTAGTRRNRSIDKEYFKLYGKAEALLENGRFQWKEEYKLRLEACEKIFNAGQKQNAMTSLNDLFEWHKMKRRDKANQRVERTAQICLTEEEHDIECHAKCDTVEKQRITKKKKQRITKEKSKDTKLSKEQVELEKNTIKKRQINAFLLDGVVSVTLLVSVAFLGENRTGEAMAILAAYSILQFVRSWFFMTCNLFMATLCLALYHAPIWWAAVIPVAFIITSILVTPKVKNKTLNGVHCLLIFLQALCISIMFSSSIENAFALGAWAFFGSLFFPMMYDSPRTVSCVSIIVCGILAFTWPPLLWWNGVALILLVLGVVWKINKKKECKRKKTRRYRNNLSLIIPFVSFL